MFGLSSKIRIILTSGNKIYAFVSGRRRARHSHTGAPRTSSVRRDQYAAAVCDYTTGGASTEGKYGYRPGNRPGRDGFDLTFFIDFRTPVVYTRISVLCPLCVRQHIYQVYLPIVMEREVTR